jgi:hypothetical protein
MTPKPWTVNPGSLTALSHEPWTLNPKPVIRRCIVIVKPRFVKPKSNKIALGNLVSKREKIVIRLANRRRWEDRFGIVEIMSKG